MDSFEKILEYDKLLKDGVISEDEYKQLKNILINNLKTEGIIANEEAFEEEFNNWLYQTAISKLDDQTLASYTEAMAILEKLGDWKSAKVILEQCRKELPELEKKDAEAKEIERKDGEFNEAVKKLETHTYSSYNEAIRIFENLGDWKDSKEYIEKAKADLPELFKKFRQDQAAEEEERKKKKRFLITLCTAAVAVLVLIGIMSVVTKPKLDNYDTMFDSSIHNMEYRVPDNCTKDIARSSGRCTLYKIDKNDKTIGVVTVEYKGETDLTGDAGYDPDTDMHYALDAAKDLIPESNGTYSTVEADNSSFEVTVYCEDSVEGKDVLLDAITKSFNTSGYKNPRTIKNVAIEYYGDTEAGTVIAPGNTDFEVEVEIDTGLGTGILKTSPTWSIKDKVTLKAGKTSTVTIVIDGRDYTTEIECATEVEEEEDSHSNTSISRDTLPARP